MDNVVKNVIAQVDEQKLIKLVRSLIDIPSTTGEERECAEFLVRYMKEAGLEAKLQEITDRRANAIGVLKGTGEGPVLMFDGHLDTAGTGIEEEDYAAMGPLAAGYKPKSYSKDGFIFGLGANNMKGGVAAAVAALDALLQTGVRLKGDVVMAGVAGESEKSPVEGAIRSYRGARYQGGGYGTRYLITHGPVPDYAVVCEPSGCYVINAQTGYFFVKITIKGKAAYQATRGPGFRGINAIEKACSVIQRLNEWDSEYVQRHRYDSRMGIIEPHLTVGAIEGGWPFKPSYSTAICNLYADLRVTPAMNPREAVDELEAVLRKIAADDPQLKYDLDVYASNVPATATSPENYLIRACLKARELVVGQKQEKFPLGMGTAYNDSNIFRQHGIPALKCGPSGGKVPTEAQGLLDEGERLSIQELVSAAKIYVALVLDICTKSRSEIKQLEAQG
jgi:acetylornithine deacetylase/succinyl-diaminopimelate desuccinylase-like protein